MDVFLQHEDDTETLIKLNICRIWSKVHYMSDLTTLDGKELLPGALLGRTQASNWDWPNYKPPRRWWETWKSYVSTYIIPLLPVETPEHQRHRILLSCIREDRTNVELDANGFTVVNGGRQSLLFEGSSSNAPCTRKCDVIQNGGKICAAPGTAGWTESERKGTTRD